MSKECTEQDCIKQIKARGLCAMHYMRLMKHGTTADPEPRRKAPVTCSIATCERQAIKRDPALCSSHYWRNKRHGDPEGGGTARGLSEPQRFWPKVDRRGPDECWPWIASLSPKGFGMFGVAYTAMAAHRWAYEAVNGPLDPDQTVDHTCHGRDVLCKGGDSCRHRRCCNPAHLEAVDPLTNVARGRSFSAQNTAKTHCKRGHALTDDNSYGYHGRRQCKTCAREAARRR